MLKEAIYIKNFGPLEEVAIPEIKKVNVFIGDSGCGKSTIMKLLVLFQWLYKQMCIRSYLKKSGVVENIREFDFKKYLRNNGILDYLHQNSEIVYTRGKYTVLYKNGKLNTRFEIEEQDLSLEKMVFISDKRNLIPDLYSSTISENSISDFFLMESLHDFKLALGTFNTLKIPAFNIILAKKKQKFGNFDLYVEGSANLDGYEVKIENSSSGMQNVIPLYTIIDYFASKYDIVEAEKNTIKSYMFSADIIDQFLPTFNLSDIIQRNIHFHIEEPELSLYPDGQIDLMNSLIRLCFLNNNLNYNISMMISTHSPYIMNYLNLAIKKNDLGFEDVSAYQVKDGRIFDLKKINNNVIDTRSLSDPIERIYRDYNLQERK